MLWSVVFGLLPQLMGPMTVYDIPITKVETLERRVRFCARKWLGVPQCLSNIARYEKGTLALPLTGLTEKFKCTKSRPDITLAESRECVKKAAPTLATGVQKKICCIHP